MLEFLERGDGAKNFGLYSERKQDPTGAISF